MDFSHKLSWCVRQVAEESPVDKAEVVKLVVSDEDWPSPFQLHFVCFHPLLHTLDLTGSLDIISGY